EAHDSLVGEAVLLLEFRSHRSPDGGAARPGVDEFGAEELGEGLGLEDGSSEPLQLVRGHGHVPIVAESAPAVITFFYFGFEADGAGSSVRACLPRTAACRTERLTATRMASRITIATGRPST